MPINVIGFGHPGLCIAVDPTDKHGVWWWDPGPSGCSTSINGPTAVIRAQQAEVVRTRFGAVNASFQLQLHRGGPLDVVLLLQDGSLRDTASGMRVLTSRRTNLDIPPAYGR